MNWDDWRAKLEGKKLGWGEDGPPEKEPEDATAAERRAIAQEIAPHLYDPNLTDEALQDLWGVKDSPYFPKDATDDQVREWLDEHAEAWEPVPPAALREALTAPIDYILFTTSGKGIVYAGEVSWVAGLPATGKSWLAWLAAQEASSQGRRVVWADYDSSLVDMAERIGITGLWPAVEDDQVRIGQEMSRSDHQQAAAWLSEADKSGLVVIDSAEASGCPINEEIADWWHALISPYVDEGHAVMVLDHLPKNDQQARGPIGSQAKLARVRGVSLRVSGKGWAIGQDGYSSVVIDKDRRGRVGQQQAEVAVLCARFDLNGAVAITLEDGSGDTPQDRADDGAEAVLGVLRAASRPMTVKEVADALGKGKTWARKRLGELSDDGEAEVCGHPEHRATQVWTASEMF